jgi:hypothetical protein
MRRLYLLLFIAMIQVGGFAQVSTYTFSQASTTYTPITGGTVLGSTTSDDQYFVNPAIPAGGTLKTGVGFPIGFNFTYNGIVFDQVGINNNGWISLGQSSLTPAVDMNTTSAYTPLSSTATNTPAQLRNRIAACAADLAAQTGAELRIQTIGTSPNQVCVIQWTNYKRLGSAGTGQSLTFQIRLNQAGNNQYAQTVEVVYGTMTFNATSSNAQVGLGGTVSTDFNNRTTSVSNDWNNTSAGVTNTASCQLLNTVTPPASGTDFIWTPLAPCSGTPTPGTITGSSEVCSGTSFNLSGTGYSTSMGVTYAWQSSVDGTNFTNVAGQTNPATGTFSETVARYYRLVDTCTVSGLVATSNVLYVKLSPGNKCFTYCVPTYTTGCTLNDRITDVELNSLSNVTGATCETTSPIGYVIYDPNVSNQTTTLTQGLTYQASISIGTGGQAGVSIWIDFNDNGIFESAERFTTSGSYIASGSTGTIQVAVPINAQPGDHSMRVRLVWNVVGSTIDPCNSYTYGETEDYTITVAPLVPCSGAPAAVTLTGPSSACAGISFNLSNDLAYQSSLNFAWQSSPDGVTFTDISKQTNPTVASVSQTLPTYYRFVDTCANSGLSAISNVVFVPMGTTAQCLCTPVYTTGCTANDRIVSIDLNTLSNYTGTSCQSTTPLGYTVVDSTVATTDLQQGVSYTATLSIGNGGRAGVVIWIDYNDNGVFEASERYNTTIDYIASGGTGTIQVDVPSLAPIGTHIMRVRLVYNRIGNTIEPCTSYTYGETEDYFIPVVAGVPCANAPSAGTIEGPVGACNSISFTLTNTGAETGTAGVKYNWQSSPDGITFTNIPGQNNAFTATVTQTTATYYRFVDSCTMSGMSGISNVIYVTMNSTAQCICIPVYTTGCTFNDKIQDVELNTLSNFTGGDCETGTPKGYIVFDPSNPSYTTHLTQAVTYTAYITTASGGAAGVAIWIDYNDNGIFEASEKYFTAGTVPSSSTVGIDIPVPSSAPVGDHVMRVRLVWNNSGTNITACGSFTYGETEDYTITIDPGTPCSGTPTAGTISGPASSCSNSPFTITNTGATAGLAGLVFRWQSSPDGITFTDIPGETNPNSLTVAQSSATYYRFVDSCTASLKNAVSNVLYVPMSSPGLCHCTTNLHSFASPCLSVVDINGMTNSTGGTCALPSFTAYDESQYTTTLYIANTYTLNINTSGSAIVSVWIDYNQNGSFEASEWQQVYTTGSTGSVDITIPNTALTGLTTMRVRARASGNPNGANDACTTFGSGETQDYLVTITTAPVPVTTLYFKGSKQTDGNLLSWKNNCNTSSLTFELQRSSNARDFAGINKFTVDASRCSEPFSYLDRSPVAGTNYYRLKYTEADGKVSYSTVVAILNGSKTFELVGLLPTLVDNGTATLNVSAASRMPVGVIVRDMQGRMLQNLNIVVESGSNTIPMNFTNLAAGSYQLSAYTADGYQQTIRFVKK